MRETINKRTGFYICIIAIIILSSACTCDPEHVVPENTYISFDGIHARTAAGTHPGSVPEDYIVRTLRILAFMPDGMLNVNVRYDIGAEDVIRHPIPPGTYDFAFVANEPTFSAVEAALNSIAAYNALRTMVFPAAAFASDLYIPMIRTIDNVTVHADGTAEYGNPAAVVSVIPLELERMAARIDLDLKAVEDLSGAFRGITLSGLPDVVPLFPGIYPESGIVRSGIRTYTVAADPEYFTAADTPVAGYEWEMAVSRIVVPSGVFTPVNDRSKAVTLTVNLEDKYNPDCLLEIENLPVSNYTLPRNTKLDVNGVIRMPLEVNVEASDWDEIYADWTAGHRKLNVSQIRADMTDLNGVRITFWSNMPVVRVLPTVTSGGNAFDTNTVFNDLAVTADSPVPNRFHFDPATGMGYLDILIDGGMDDALNTPGNYTYTLTLSAEESNGSNALQREITVNVTQQGTRPELNTWGNGYTGAFYRNNEVGERIITAQQPLESEWSVYVPDEFKDMITLSSTPSFDPGAGTDTPGNPELYAVIPNAVKSEDGTYVKGRGRIYFRIGLKAPHTLDTPKYAYLGLNYDLGWGRIYTRFYIRQGEAGDYIYSAADAIPTPSAVAGQTRDSARKFTPYNLTTPEYRAGGKSSYCEIEPRKGAFVEYPTQAGALFPWGKLDQSTLPRAYHPTEPHGTDDWEDLSIDFDSGFWTGAYAPSNEWCPPGYSRPNDGYEDRIAYNGVYDATGAPAGYTSGNYNADILDSEFRTSLFLVPEAGNGYDFNAVPTYPASEPEPSGTSRELAGTRGGIYADGFFDRRPINQNSAGKGADIAYHGLLIFNEATHASLFFPSAGRMVNTDGRLEYQGATGYYWTSSIGPWYTDASYPAWSFALTYHAIGPTSQVSGFAMSIRCVED